MKKEIFKVTGMTCPHCEARLTRVLQGVNGVSTCVASHTAGTVICEYDEGKTDNISISQAIDDAGFEVLE